MGLDNGLSICTEYDFELMYDTDTSQLSKLDCSN